MAQISSRIAHKQNTQQYEYQIIKHQMNSIESRFSVIPACSQKRWAMDDRLPRSEKASGKAAKSNAASPERLRLHNRAFGLCKKVGRPPSAGFGFQRSPRLLRNPQTAKCTPGNSISRMKGRAPTPDISDGGGTSFYRSLAFRKVRSQPPCDLARCDGVYHRIGPFASFQKKTPQPGGTGAFVRPPSKAPAERRRTNRRETDCLHRTGRGANRAVRSSSFGLRPIETPRCLDRVSAHRSHDRKRPRVNEFSWVPVSLNPPVKESGRAFASFVACTRTKEGSPAGDGKG